jgi:hypothetical protein
MPEPDTNIPSDRPETYADGTPFEPRLHQDKPRDQILDEYYWQGFGDGWQSGPARSVSNAHEPQCAYFDGFRDARKQVRRLEPLAESGGRWPGDKNRVSRLLYKAVDEFLDRAGAGDPDPAATDAPIDTPNP